MGTFTVDADWTRGRNEYHRSHDGTKVSALVRQIDGPSDEFGDFAPGLLTCEVEARTLADGTPIITLLVRRESREKEVLLRWNSVDGIAAKS